MNISSSEGLTHLFLSEIRRREHSGRVERGRAMSPTTPTLVVYLGGAALHPALSAALEQLWPQHSQEIVYIELRAPDALYCPDTGAPLALEEATARISHMFSPSTHFADRSHVSVFAVADASPMHSAEDLLLLHEALGGFLSQLPGVESRVLLFLLLNEDLVQPHRAVAQGLRNVLADFEGPENPLPAIHSVCLLSTRRADNSILRAPEQLCRLVAVLAALSVSACPEAPALWEHRVCTAGYAREEKPLEEIARTVVQCLIDHLASLTVAAPLQLSGDVLRRTGLTERGTWALLDEFAKNLPLPDPAYFPRRSPEDLDLYALCFEDADAYTLHTCTACLEQACATLALDIPDLQRRYADTLRARFSVAELVQLQEHVGRLQTKPQPVPRGLPLREGARARLSAMLSGNPQITEALLATLHSVCEEARVFQAQWEALLSSRAKDFYVEAHGLRAYYEALCLRDFHSHAQEIAQKADRVRSPAQQEAFLLSILQGLIERHTVFTMPFEEELEARMQSQDRSVDAKEYIRSRLSGQSVCVCLHLPFALGAPCASFVLMDTDTPLKQKLSETLVDRASGRLPSGIDETWRYISTGSGAMAETVRLYPVSPAQLMT